MNCLEPIVLNNGYIVPCGKCLLCRSAQREEWSVRLQLHSDSYNKMPLFITLTYDDNHLSYSDDGPSLVKSDVALFLKRYKDRYNLYNKNFSYFGCGEYGDTFHRPHYHLLFFGDLKLQRLFDQDSALADEHVRVVWKKGFVRVFQAQWSGIHYVTKYVLKDEMMFDAEHDLRQAPFTIWSHGLGFGWLQSLEAKRLKRLIRYYAVWHEDIQQALPFVDFSTPYDAMQSSKMILDILKMHLPSLKVQLPSGEWAYLPRALRSRLLGKFEHHMDNPFWFYNYFKSVYDSTKYWLDMGCDDILRPFPVSYQQSLNRCTKIMHRLILNHHKKQKV